MQRERDIERACVQYVRSKDCLAIKLRAPPIGLPDRLIVLPDGYVWWVEFKTPRGKLTPAQRRMIAALIRLGHTVSVVSDVRKFKKALDFCSGVI